jgi:hypothetical protein
MLLLAVTSSAASTASNGRLIVYNPGHHVGVGTMVHIVSQPAPRTFRTTVYVPAGYRTTGGGFGAVGNVVGKAHVYLTKATGGRTTLNGTLTAVAPSSVPHAPSCAAATGHAAVWMLQARQATGPATIQFPVYIDTHKTASLPAGTAYRIRWCGGAANTTIDEVDLDLVRMFINPEARGMYFWRAVYEPAAANGREVMSAGSVSVAAAVPISPEVSLQATHQGSSPHLVTFSGFVHVVNQPLGHVKVQLFLSHSKRIALNTPTATVWTAADGSYSITRKLAGSGPWYVRVKASTPFRDITPGGGCLSLQSPKLSAKGCVDATLEAFVVLSTPVKRAL